MNNRFPATVLKFLLIVFCFLGGFCFHADRIASQSLAIKDADSLKKQILPGSGHNQSGLLNMISVAYHEIAEYDSSLFYALEAFDEAARQSDVPNQAQAMKNKAEVYFSLNAFKDAISAYEEAVSYYETTGQREELSYCNNVIGILHRKQFNYKKALEHALISLKIAEEINHTNRMSVALFNVAMIHHSLMQYDQAIAYYKRSMKMDESQNDTLGVAKALCNLGICYSDKKDLNSALDCYIQSHKLYSAIRDSEGIALTLNNTGMLYLRTGRYEEAFDYLQQAKALFEMIHDIEGQAYALNGIGDVYYNLHQIPRALASQHEALQLTHESDLRKNIYQSLTKLYDGTGNYRKAYEYYLLYSAEKDSIINRENSQHLAEIHVKFETEKKEQEIEFLKIVNDRQKDNQLWLISGLIFLAVFVFFISISRRRIIRIQKRLNKMNACFVSFGYEPENNIQKITKLLHELTGAEFAVYLRRQESDYVVKSKWNTPEDFPYRIQFDDPIFHAPSGFSSGQFKIIFQPALMTLMKNYRFTANQPVKSVLIHPVKFNQDDQGLLIAAFPRRYKPSREEQKITGILALAAGTEEERRIAEEALQSSERRYHDLFDQSLGFIGVHDMNGYWLMVNPAAARSLGYSPSEMASRPITDFLTDGMKRLFKRYLKQIHQSESYTGMMRVQTKDKQQRVWAFHNIKYEEPGKEPFVLGHALDITEIISARKDREKLIHDLQHALARVKTLSGLLPICAGCKKIRDDKGYWNQIESYISYHSNAEFSHGMCPDCQRRLYPELFADDDK